MALTEAFVWVPKDQTLLNPEILPLNSFVELKKTNFI
jgi:hypothetical protein